MGVTLFLNFRIMDNQKKYEEAANAHAATFFQLSTGPGYQACVKDFLTGASFAEKEGWNAAIDKALKCFTAEAYASHNDVWKEIEKLKI